MITVCEQCFEALEAPHGIFDQPLCDNPECFYYDEYKPEPDDDCPECPQCGREIFADPAGNILCPCQARDDQEAV